MLIPENGRIISDTFADTCHIIVTAHSVLRTILLFSTLLNCNQHSEEKMHAGIDAGIYKALVSESSY